MLANTVPPISYLTRLDAYAFGSLLFLLLATTMHAVIGYLIDDCDIEARCTFGPSGLTQAAAKAIDGTFLWVYVGSWILFNAL